MFISGMMIGIVFSKTYVSTSLANTFSVSLRRGLKILRYYIAVYFLSALPLVFVELDAESQLYYLFRQTDPLSIESFGLFLGAIYRPLMFDILYLYVVFISLSPLIIHLVKRQKLVWLVVCSFFLWTTVQYGLTGKFIEKVAATVGFERLYLLGSFDTMAWQFVFVLGAIVGIKLYDDASCFVRLGVWLRKNMMALLFGVCVAFAVYKILVEIGVISIKDQIFSSYLNLGFMTLLNFSAFAGFVFCVLSAGADDLNGPGLKCKQILERLLNSNFLTVMGRNTLQTYSVSVIVVYWLAFMSFYTQINGYVSNTLVAVLVLAVVYASGRIQDRRMGRSISKP